MSEPRGGARSDVDVVQDLPPRALLEVAPGVRALVNFVPFPPGVQNAVVLEDEIDGRAGWTVVDPGLRSGEPFWRDMLAGPLGDRPVLRVIATHHHPDHIGLAGWLQSEHGAALWTTRTAWLFARMLNLDAPPEPPLEAIAFYRRAGFDDAMIDAYRARQKFNFNVTVAPLPLGFQRIAEGDVIEIGARRFKVEVGHGHAPEHAILVSQSDDLVIAGDMALPKISPNIGVYPTEPRADPLGEWLDSCARLSGVLTDDQLVIPGHGPVFRGASSRMRRIAQIHEERLGVLAAHLAEPRRVVDCFAALFRRKIDAAAQGLATVEAIAHLNHLEAAGRARREDRDGVDYWSAIP